MGNENKWIECLHEEERKKFKKKSSEMLHRRQQTSCSFVNKLWNEILHKIIVFLFLLPSLCDLLLFFHILRQKIKRKKKSMCRHWKNFFTLCSNNFWFDFKIPSSASTWECSLIFHFAFALSKILHIAHISFIIITL